MIEAELGRALVTAERQKRSRTNKETFDCQPSDRVREYLM